MQQRLQRGVGGEIVDLEPEEDVDAKRLTATGLPEIAELVRHQPAEAKGTQAKLTRKSR